MALITRYDGAVTNPAGLPLDLIPVGVDGYAGRWIANLLPGGDSSLVDSWPSVVTDQAARTLAASGAARPALKVAGVDKFVQFDGVDDFLLQSGTSAAWKTTIVLGRFDVTLAAKAQLVAMAAATGPWLQRNSAGTVKVTGGGNLDINSVATVADSVWKVFSIVQDGANSLVGVDGTIASGTLGTRAVSALSLAKTDSGFGQVSIAEALVYNTALTATQLQTISAALRANHAALVA